MREARCPDAARIWVAQHIELARARERAREQPPVDQVARMMNLHAGKPFEGRGGNVIIIADAQNGRVGIEAGKDGIVYGHTGFTWVGATARRAASSRSIWLTRFWLSG